MYGFSHTVLGWRCTSQVLTHVAEKSAGCFLLAVASRDISGHCEESIQLWKHAPFWPSHCPCVSFRFLSPRTDSACLGHPLYPFDADGYACFEGCGSGIEWHQDRKSDQGFRLMIIDLILNINFMFHTSGVSCSSIDASLHIKSSVLHCSKVFCL